MSQPYLEGVGGWTSHSQNWDLGVLRDSRNFKVRLQGSKHFALGCSLYHLKASKIYMSKMASHGPFGHLQHKLWQKERSGVKLPVLLPTTKSWESTRPWCVQAECDTLLESSRGELQVCFRPHLNQRSEQRVMTSQSSGNPNRDSFETLSWESWDKKPIWMWVLQKDTEYTIWGKVVTSLESGLWWVKWVQSCPWLVLAPRVLQKVN